MKKLLMCFLTVGSISLLALSSCQKSDVKVVTNGGTPGTLSSSSTTLVLDKTQLNSSTAAITFTTTAPTYSFTAAATNTLQIDVAGDNWKNPTSVALATKVYSQSYTTSEFNAMLLKLSLPAGQASSINVRVQYALSSSVITYSNVVAVSVTPFNLASWVWVPGDYEGWNNSSAADSLLSATGNGVYTGLIYFPAGGTLQFKIVPVKGSWTVAYGGTVANGTATLSTSGGNLQAPSSGEMLLTANFNTNVLTIVPADSYSLIGSAAPGTAWSTDTQLKFINDGNNAWVLNGVAMTVGEYKFRLDDAWNTSWGPGAAANSAVTSGAVGDGNMQLTVAGNYNLTLVQPPTTLGSTNPAPLATTTYTAVKQ